ncbi:DpnD/PcfM family protein [Psychrobacter sp. M13]|uniref:DpnD/PcfM family protein n=1 Tax=Psychrobacter sp. M13 TaxID=3067275 RepID=UPI00273BEA74|nr:DpnD/PcfM family protein [Psychrobacter sp. M13]WLP94710.1 DpnD/PcfM family protein [Psychrobacter sp. M13]
MTNEKELKTYQVEIIETLSRVVEIVAEDDSSAILKANEKYRNEDIVLYPDDMMDTEFIIY